MLEARILKRRRDFTVDVDLKIDKGGCLALFGASGSGKSTILSCIAGIEQPDEGRVSFGGARFFPPPMPLHARNVGYLTQDPHLFPHLSVERNISFGVGPAMRAEERVWIERLRDSLALGDIWKASASGISGGQARRVSVARMLARRPPLILLDEPFTGLDRYLVRELIGDLLEWKHEIEFSMIVVDHQSEILERLCPRVAVISKGRVIQQATWSEVRAQPADAELESLLRPL